ncbi:hypothetical protein ACFL0H_00060 [Thermodesulfobacteriota bacterium]
MAKDNNSKIVVLISADAEWHIIRGIFANAEYQTSPLGEWFIVDLQVGSHLEPVVFFHGGCGKIAAAASTQYVIDKWSPSLLVNLGTCGGIEGEVEVGTIILVEKTIVYDIIDEMKVSTAGITHYTTELDLSWLSEPYPSTVRRAAMVSADRDLMVSDIPVLRAKYGAIAADWESGAIAYVASKNGTRCLILRGVSDLVGWSGGEVYGNQDLFEDRVEMIMHKLIDTLPDWIL